MIIRPEKEPRELHSSVVLLAIALPVDYVEKTQVDVENFRLSQEEREILRIQLEMTLKKSEAHRYLRDQLAIIRQVFQNNYESALRRWII